MNDIIGNQDTAQSIISYYKATALHVEYKNIAKYEKIWLKLK